MHVFSINYECHSLSHTNFLKTSSKNNLPGHKADLIQLFYQSDTFHECKHIYHSTFHTPHTIRKCTKMAEKNNANTIEVH